VLLFSGGKDSIVLLRLAEKAFRPARFPLPVMHVDTGHNFPEVVEFRDRRIAELGERLIVASVQESIDAGRVVEETGPGASRNRLQTTTLLDAIAANGFDAARRDEKRARAKERVFSFRDDLGQCAIAIPTTLCRSSRSMSTRRSRSASSATRRASTGAPAPALCAV
jgi:sulfate adenylyltransferase subunit 2